MDRSRILIGVQVGHGTPGRMKHVSGGRRLKTCRACLEPEGSSCQRHVEESELWTAGISVGISIT